MPTYPVRNFLDVSTAHLRPATRAWVTDQLANPTARHPQARAATSGGNTPYGFFVWSPETAPDEGSMPDDLRQALILARCRDCEYVLFDRDAPTNVLPLPVYPDEEPLWRVRVDAQALDTLWAIFEVRAASEEEAKRLAIEFARDNAEWNWDSAGTPENLQVLEPPEIINETA